MNEAWEISPRAYAWEMNAMRDVQLSFVITGYPRHAWPDDPLTARPPEPKPRRWRD